MSESPVKTVYSQLSLDWLVECYRDRFRSFSCFRNQGHLVDGCDSNPGIDFDHNLGAVCDSSQVELVDRVWINGALCVGQCRIAERLAQWIGRLPSGVDPTDDCGNPSSTWVIATIFADGHASLSDIADVSEY